MGKFCKKEKGIDFEETYDLQGMFCDVHTEGIRVEGLDGGFRQVPETNGQRKTDGESKVTEL